MPPSVDGVSGDSHHAGPFTCFDQSWWIHAADPQLTELLRTLYGPMRSPPSRMVDAVEYRTEPERTGAGGTLLRDGEVLGRELTPGQLLGRLLWAINRQVIDRVAPHRLLLHASAAADTVGRVVLLPAPMEHGKTTLVTGLLDRGLGYLTDEAAAVDADLTVRGFAKPLSIDRGAWHLFPHHEPGLPAPTARYMAGQWQVPAHRFTQVHSCGRLALIVFPTHSPGAPTTLRRLRPIEALDIARASTFAPGAGPLPAVRIRQLAAMVTRVPCYRLRSGDLAEACHAVLTAMDEQRIT